VGASQVPPCVPCMENMSGNMVGTRKIKNSMVTPPNSEGKNMSPLKCMFSHLFGCMQILFPKISCHHFLLKLIPLLVDTYNDIRVFFFQISQVGPLVKILNTN